VLFLGRKCNLVMTFIYEGPVINTTEYLSARNFLTVLVCCR